MPMIYKYVTPARVDILENMKIRASPIYSLNDPFECFFAGNPPEHERADAEDDGYRAEWASIKVQLESTLGNMGLLCFTSAYDSIPMWAHYADNHRGLVIGFDETSSMFKACCGYTDPTYRIWKDLTGPGFGSLRSVEYVDELVEVEHGAEVSLDIAFRKGRAWSYEQEIRIFRSRRDCTEVNVQGGGNIWLLDIPPNTIRKIIVGVNADYSLLDRVSDIVSRSDMSAVKVHRARIDPRRYGLILDKM